MFKFIIFLIVIYLFVKLLFNFILPVTRATAEVKSKIKAMQEEELKRQTSDGRQTHQQPVNAKTKDADYIDFEEVK